MLIRSSNNGKYAKNDSKPIDPKTINKYKTLFDGGFDFKLNSFEQYEFVDIKTNHIPRLSTKKAFRGIVQMDKKPHIISKVVQVKQKNDSSSFIAESTIIMERSMDRLYPRAV